MMERLPIPDDAKFEVINGESFLRVAVAAKIAKIHPVAMEMARELLKSIGVGGAAFQLATPEMLAKGDQIQKELTKGLRKCAKQLEPNRKIKTKAKRDGDRLVFWYAA